MSRRKRIILTLFGMLGLTGLLFCWWLLRPTPGITLENFQRLYVGMSEDDVERLLGPGEKERAIYDWATVGKHWNGNDCDIHLRFNFDPSGRPILFSGEMQSRDGIYVLEDRERTHFLLDWLERYIR